MDYRASSTGFVLFLLSVSVQLSRTSEVPCTKRDPDLHVQMSIRPRPLQSQVDLQCVSSCCLPTEPSYIWYKNGQRVSEGSKNYACSFTRSDSFSCAVKGLEDFPSNPSCVPDALCDRLSYTQRSIFAFEGATVDIVCSYNQSDTDNFWFRHEHPQQEQDLSTPEDLSKDPEYAGRVQVFTASKGSTLRITNLTEKDSAQYRFKSSPTFDQLPGTTVTVIALRVQLIRETSNNDENEIELKCHSSCDPASGLLFVWFKNGQKLEHSTEDTSTYTDQFHLGDYVSCAFRQYEDNRSPPVYPSRFLSISVSPSSQIVEGSSVTLTCAVHANYTVKITWHKGNQTLPLGSGGVYTLASIGSEDRGLYSCTSEYHSKSLFIDVEYAPRPPSVSVSPSAQIIEGSSVTLSCSSDANPPVTEYTWYKGDEDSPTASGQNFTISDVRLEHSGNYYCEAQNSRGRQRAALYLTVGPRPWKIAVSVSVPVIFISLVLLIVGIFLRKRKQDRKLTEDEEETNNKEEQMEGVDYTSVQFFKTQVQDEPLYSNAIPPHLHRPEGLGVIYSNAIFNSDHRSGTRDEVSVEDSSTLYSAVKKTH